MSYNLTSLTTQIVATFTAIKALVESNKTSVDNQIANLQPAEPGKGLSTNDLTNDRRDKLDSSPNFYTGPTDPTGSGTVPEGSVWFKTE